MPKYMYQWSMQRLSYVITLDGVHDLWNDIHKLEASFLDVCGHVAKPTVEH